MSKFQIVFSLVIMFILSSCGNPHLLRRGANGVSSISPGDNPEPTFSPTPTFTASPTPTPTITYDLNVKIIENDIVIDTLDFGSVPRNVYPRKNIAIKNFGNVKAKLDKSVLPSDVNFELLDRHHCLGEIDPLESCVVQIIFKSKRIGESVEDISFTYYSSEMGVGKTLTLNLKLKGIKTKICPTGTIDLSASGNSASGGVNFEKSRIEDEITSYVVIKNNSDFDVFYVPSEIVNENFEIINSSNCLEKIQAHGQCVLKIKFKSKKSGKITSTLELKFVDESENSEGIIKIPVEGEKVSQRVSPEIKFSPFDAQGIDFGNVTVGSSYSKLLEIQNNNDQNLVLSIDDVKIEEKNKDFEFSGGKFPGLRGTCKDLLRPGRCLVDITFRPTTFGVAKANIVIISQGQILLNTSIIANGVDGLGNDCTEKFDYLFFSDGKFPLNDPSIIYPYLKKSKVGLSRATLSLLYGLETNTGFACPDCEAVKDSMVLTRFSNINLPLINLVNATLQLHVGKISPSTRWLYTEMLCLQNSQAKLCSGELFDSKGEPSWYALVNREFFGAIAKTQNLKFNNYLQQDQKVVAVKLKDGSKIYKSTIMSQLDISELFDVKLVEVETILRKGYLNLILVDDTKNVSYPRIITTFKKDITCEDKK